MDKRTLATLSRLRHEQLSIYHPAEDAFPAALSETNSLTSSVTLQIMPCVVFFFVCCVCAERHTAPITLHPSVHVCMCMPNEPHCRYALCVCVYA